MSETHSSESVNLPEKHPEPNALDQLRMAFIMREQVDAPVFRGGIPRFRMTRGGFGDIQSAPLIPYDPNAIVALYDAWLTYEENGTPEDTILNLVYVVSTGSNPNDIVSIKNVVLSKYSVLIDGKIPEQLNDPFHARRLRG